MVTLIHVKVNGSVDVWWEDDSNRTFCCTDPEVQHLIVIYPDQVVEETR